MPPADRDASPPSAAPPLLPEALADPVLRDLLPPDPDTAARLLNDLTVMDDRIDAATALRASGDAARAQEAEYAARQIYDFWSAFYRNQERIALIAERLHKLSVMSIAHGESHRLASQSAAEMPNGAAERPRKSLRDLTSDLSGVAHEPDPYSRGYLNRVFMAEALAAIKEGTQGKKHVLHKLYDHDTDDWNSRAPDAEKSTVQAGHLVSRYAGLREHLALEDSSFNQISNEVGETQNAIFIKTALNIDGIPVERRTAQLWESQGILPAGTVKKASPHPGWTRIRKPRKHTR
jgi:hypothetical protein